MIRDWGLWELTDEDWHGFVPVRDRQKQQENAAKTPQEQESLAPDAGQQKADALSSLLQEKGELEAVSTSPKTPVLKPESLEENNPPKPDRSISSPVQKEQDLEPIRVSSPKVSQPPPTPQTQETSETILPPPSEPTPVQSQEAEFETVEVKEEAIAPPEPAPVSAPPPEPETGIPSQRDAWEDSAPQTALKVGDWNVPADEIVPLLEKYQLLPKLVREIIIDREIVSIDCSSEELTQATEGFYQQQQINSPQKLQAWLQQKRTTTEQVKNAIVRGVKLEKFKEKMWSDRLESDFLERKPQLDKVLYSLLRTQDLGVAQELYFRILEGEEEFSHIAQEYSQGVEAKTGGIVGPISLSKIHPTLKEMFQRSQPGQLWSPQYIDNWFVVVRLEQFVPAQLDEEIRQQLLDERFKQWLQEQYQQVTIQ
ncbi:MAG: peptidylprolyl isomerase [Spirulina sp.]